MVSRRMTFALLAFLGLTLPLRLEAQDLQGAASALQQMSAQKPAAPKAPPKKQNPIEAFRHDLEAFRDKASTLPPQAAANGWLALVDRYSTSVKAANNGNQGDGTEPLTFQEILAALPPPAAWNALTAAIQARQPAAPKRTVRDLSLLLLSHVLQNNPTAQWKDLDAMQTLLTKTAEDQRSSLAQTIMSLSDALTKQSGDPERILQGIELHLAIQQLGGQNYGGRENMPLPDLVTLLGAQRAENLLHRVIVISDTMIEVPVGDATRRLAQKLALELVPKMKVPQWKLAESLDTTDLYAAMEKRFIKPAKADPKADPKENIARAVAGGSGQGQFDNSTARAYYLLGLIVKGRTQQAAQVAASFGKDQTESYVLHEALTALDRSGHTRELADFLQAELKQNPNLPFWDTYIETAPKAGQTAAMLTLVRAAATRKDLSKERQAALQTHLYQALLAADHVDEAVPIMRRILAQPEPEPNNGQDDRPQTALQLLRLGYYLKQDAWIQEGITAFDTALHAENAYQLQIVGGEYAHLLTEMGRYAEAEKTLIWTMAVSAAHQQRGGRFGEEDAFGVQQAPEQLIELAQLYYHAGRYADVITLLDYAPNWMAKDLSDLGNTPGRGNHDLPIEYIAAVALAETGKGAEAIPILESLLNQNGGFDPGYERLLALQGEAILPFLDTRFQHDRFEERPLIWKAIVLQRAGRLEDAEKTVREAIAIDPSDGEEGHGDRMRAYSVLADIREARGDQQQATLYREAVRSIRISEHADDLLQAGLVTQAIKLYEEALTHFADAYCIQARLAIQMMESGNLKEAEEHYRRAYELMPTSFGRMESHCFGCEGVFRGKVPESIAGKVFQELLKKTPNKPQVHYLMGYLREEQERFAEALVYYREAVTLDPDYINAWSRLQGLGEHITLPQALRNTAALNQMRLHNDVNVLSEVTDLRATWAAVQTARAANPPRKKVPLYPLAASKAAIEKREADYLAKNGTPMNFSRYGNRQYRGMYNALSDDETEATGYIPLPGQVIAQQQVVSQLSTMLDWQPQ